MDLSIQNVLADKLGLRAGSDAGPPIGGPNEYSDLGGDPTGTLAMGWGSGTANFSYVVTVGIIPREIAVQKGYLNMFFSM